MSSAANAHSVLASPDFDVLRERAYNLRWASVEPGVIPLTAADPDFPVAPEVVEAIANYIARPHLCYGPAAGLAPFREAVAAHFNVNKGAQVDPCSVTATNAAASAIALVARHLLRAGDEVIVQDPVDFLVAESVRRAGGTIRFWRHDRGRFTRHTLRAAVTEKTRAIFVCHPHNPMGTLWSDDEVRGIAAFAAERGLAIVSDEVWSDTVLDGRLFTSFAAAQQGGAQPWVIYGLSKGFALAGLRIGAVIAPTGKDADAFRADAGFDHTIEGASTISQVAATAALEKCGAWQNAFLEHIAAQRVHAIERLRALDGVEISELTEATFVVFPRITETGIDEEEFTQRIERYARVRVVAGSPRWFGNGARGHIRLSLATTPQTLDEALDRMQRSWSKILAR